MAKVYRRTPCQIVGTTPQTELGPTDFELRTTATPNAGNFDIRVELHERFDGYGDVASFVNTGTATIFDDVADTVATGTDAGPNSTGAPDYVAVTFASVAPTSGNVGNTWKITFVNVQVVCKDGTTKTIPTLTKTFPSPL